MTEINLTLKPDGKRRWLVIENAGGEDEQHVGTIRQVDRRLYQAIHPAGSAWAPNTDEALGRIRDALTR